MFAMDIPTASQRLKINSHIRWKQIEARTQSLIASVAARLKIESIFLKKIADFQPGTLEQDITKCLLAVPEIHFRKQFHPVGKHKWVSSQGIVLKLQGNNLMIDQTSDSLNTVTNEKHFIDAIQAYRTKLRRVTTYNTIVPFSVIDFFDKVPEIRLSSTIQDYPLNFKVPLEEFDKLRKRARQIIKYHIWPNIELRTKFYEFSGRYIPTITSAGRLQQLYPVIIRKLKGTKRKKIRVLDIGCAPKIGYGSPTLVQFAQTLESSGFLYECLGIDIQFPIDFIRPADELHENHDHQILYKEHNICHSLPEVRYYDVVFCCNVINWYDAQPEMKRKILQNVQKAVAENGLLIIDNSNYFYVLQRNSDKFKFLFRTDRMSLEALS